MSEEIAGLVAAVQELLDAYTAAGEAGETLITALLTRDFKAVQEAVGIQTRVLATVEAAEARRQAAMTALEAHLPGATGCTSLLPLLPPADEARLAQLRHDLLTAMLHAQETGRQAMGLLRSAQAVTSRLIKATVPQTVGYGSRGEQTVARFTRAHVAARWA